MFLSLTSTKKQSSLNRCEQGSPTGLLRYWFGVAVSLMISRRGAGAVYSKVAVTRGDGDEPGLLHRPVWQALTYRQANSARNGRRRPTHRAGWALIPASPAPASPVSMAPPPAVNAKAMLNEVKKDQDLHATKTHLLSERASTQLLLRKIRDLLDELEEKGQLTLAIERRPQDSILVLANDGAIRWRADVCDLAPFS